MVPLMLGAADMRFPRLNNVRYWLIPASLVLIVAACLVDRSCGTRWTVYPPLSTVGHPGYRVDLAIFSLHCAGVRSILGGINFMTTVKNMRRASVTLEHLPLFV